MVQAQREPNTGPARPDDGMKGLLDLFSRNPTPARVTTHALGQRQRPALFRLLVEGYRRFGFYADVPTTWGLDHDPRDQPGAAKRFPTLRDLKDSVWRRLVMMKMGQTQTTTAALEKVVTLAKRRAHLRKRLKTAEGEEHDKIEAALTKARSEASEAFAEGLEQIDIGTELEELILWNNADGVQSLFDGLEGLDNSGIFRGTPSVFPRGVTVHDYNIKALDVAEQQLFVDCLMERLYVGAKQRGESDGPVEFIIIDEADVFTCDDPDHIINKGMRGSLCSGVR